MVTVLVLAVVRALVTGGRAFSHAVCHAVAWLAEPDTFRYGACVDCGPARRELACERRHVATGRYYR